jgi:hypothetical protein
MIKVYLNRKVSETQITIGNQYESGVNAIDFDLSELKQKWPNGNIYLLVSRKKHTWPYSIDDGEFKIEYVLTWKRGFYQMNVVVTDEKITDQLESSNTIFVSDTINAYVNENQINAKALNEQELPRELQIVYDDLITLKKNIEKDLADGKYIGPQGPKGEPGDVTEEYRNLASQIAQNASDAQASATNAQVSATNAQKALDDTKDFVNQTKTELNQIKTDTRVLKDEANTSAVNAQSSATNAQVSATNAQKALDDTKDFANQTKTELSQIKTDTSELKDEANTSAVNAKASEDKAKEYADHLKENTDAISQNTKAINELNDKKITKFYASNQGETHVTDSDKGLIQNLKIYGQSKQDGEPSPSNPVEIKNVVNPKMSVCGSNILQKDKKYIKQTKFGGNVTLNDDESLSYDGSILNAYATAYIQELTLKKGTYQLLANQYSSSNDIGAKLIIEKASGYLYALNNTPFTIDVDDTNCRLFISSEDEANYPLAVSGTVRCALVYSGSTTDIQPYIGKSVNLPITLNAIPVSSGGNVTINGQQYISDYVDVERSKLVKCVSKKTLNGTELYDHPKHWNDNAFVINDFIDNGILYEDYNAIADIISDKLVKTSPSAIADRGTIGIGLAFKKAYICLGDGYNTAEKIKEYFSSNNTEVYYVLNTPTETDLTIEQAQSLKELATYYPITNISVNSEQLEGYTVFNYPISLANGWNYVKKQLNDNRDYIYDMDLQSAEAYVNSEYAVTLTELEV